MALSSKEVFAWGNGKAGQLGVKLDKSNVPLPIEFFTGKSIKTGSLGWEHSAVVTSDGLLYTWGDATNFKLGYNTESSIEYLPRQLPLKNIVKVSCGFNHSAAINTVGKVFTWGNGHLGQLGTGKMSAPNEICEISLSNNIVQSVKCGRHFTVFLDNKANVYYTGKGEYTNGSTNSIAIPSICSKLKTKKIRKIVVAGGSTAAITADNNVFVWGQNNEKVLINDDKSLVKAPTALLDDPSITMLKVFLGPHSAFALDTRERFVCWGSSRLFRLTDKIKEESISVPRTVTFDFLKSIGVFEAFSFENSEIKYLLEMLRVKGVLTLDKLVELGSKVEENMQPEIIRDQDETIRIELNRILESLINPSGRLNFKQKLSLEKVIASRTLQLGCKKPNLVMFQKESNKKLGKLFDVIENLDSVELFFTCFYLHPCEFGPFFHEDNESSRMLLEILFKTLDDRFCSRSESLNFDRTLAIVFLKSILLHYNFSYLTEIKTDYVENIPEMFLNLYFDDVLP